MTQSTRRSLRKNLSTEKRIRRRGEGGKGEKKEMATACYRCVEEESRPVTRTVSRVRFLIFLLCFSPSPSPLRQARQVHISYVVSHLPRTRWEPRESAPACETSRSGSQKRRGSDRKGYIERGRRERERGGGWLAWGSTEEIEVATCIGPAPSSYSILPVDSVRLTMGDRRKRLSAFKLCSRQ